MASDQAYKESTVNTNGILGSKEGKFLQTATCLTIIMVIILLALAP